MPTNVILIEAGPTPWESEERVVGNSSLPLTAEAMDAIRHRLETIAVPITAVYRPGMNEACTQAAHIVTEKYRIRARDSAGLDEVSLGLWQGLMPGDIRQRFPTAFRKWEESPLLVTPPDGEPLEAAIGRIGSAVKMIARRNRGYNVALALRPMALQIATAVLQGRSAADIAAHLHDRTPIATIEVSE
jgi:probable phosphoglycerate mutase